MRMLNPCPRDRRLQLVALLFIIVVATSWAQQAPSTQSPTFRSQAALVLVPVIVQRDGKHIAGLKAEEFTVLEDGVRQQIASLEEVTGQEQVHWQSAVPGIYTNGVATEQSAGRLTVYLFDLINTPFPKQSFARESLVRFLLALPDSRDPVMLAVMMPGGLRVLHSFTLDPALLRASLSQIKGILSENENSTRTLQGEQEAREAATQAVSTMNQGHPERDPAEVARLTELFRDLPKAFQQARDIKRTQLTLDQLQQLAQGLVGVPGRKSLIWVTGGLSYAVGADIPIPLNSMPPRSKSTPGTLMGDVADSNDRFDATWAILTDANISVYPVDVAELENPCYADVNMPQTKCGEHSMWAFTWGLRAQAMNGFADRTGGRYCPLQSRLEDCFRSAIEDSAQYYLVAYRPVLSAKGTWRKLSVKVAVPGAHVRTRSGYFVQGRNESPEAKNVQITQAMASSLDATGLPVAMHWLDSGPQTAGKIAKLSFEIFVDPRAITFDGDSQNHFHLTLMAAHRNEKGVMTRRLAKNIEGQPGPEQLRTLLAKGLLYRDSIEVPADSGDIRFVVRDEISGRIGSVTAKR